MGEIDVQVHGLLIEPRWDRQCFLDRPVVMLPLVFIQIKVYHRDTDILSQFHVLELRWRSLYFYIEIFVDKVQSQSFPSLVKGIGEGIPLGNTSRKIGKFRPPPPSSAAWKRAG